MSRLAAIQLVTLLLVCPAPVRAQSAKPPTEMARFVVGLLYKGPAWTAQVTDETKKLQEGHMQSVNRLIESGQMALAGPFDDAGDLRGMFIFNVKSVAEARTLVETDPAVQAKRLRVDLFSWYGPAAVATVVRPAKR